jgi:recombination protein RecT
MSSQLAQRAEAARAPAKTDVETTIAHLIERQKAQLARALPRLMDPDRFARILITECKANPQLLKAEPTSMMAAVMKAAALGLEPGPLGHCYFVPFRNGKTGKTEVTFIIGYKGIIDLARRSGQVSELYAEVVYEGDEFAYQLGLNRDLTHKRTPMSKRDHVTHAYAIAKYRDGGFDFRVLDEIEIAARRARSKASKDGPWVTDYDPMCRKTAVRALAPYLPLTIEVARTLDTDERSYDLTDFGDVIDADSDEGQAAIEAAAEPEAIPVPAASEQTEPAT